MSTHSPVSTNTTRSSLMLTSATSTDATTSSVTLTASTRHHIFSRVLTPLHPSLLYHPVVVIILKSARGLCLDYNMPSSTLLWGTANPEGLKDTYKGVYLNASDISGMVSQVSDANVRGQSIPVKLEHTGVSLGRVVSAWANQRGALECVLEIDENLLEGSISAEFVRAGVCKDLSLGYTVEMAQSKLTGQISSRRKKLNEISIVVKGARNRCNVHGISKREAR